MMIPSALSLLLTLSATAATIPENSLIQPGTPTEVKVNQIVKYLPIAGHHFNVKAPQECGGSEAIKSTPMEVQCQFTSAGKQNLDLKVCDDKVTFCKSEIFSVNVSGESKAAKGSNAFKPKGHVPMAKGFLLNDFKKAAAQAKKENKLLFIDFYAIWCPPCNMYEEFVFEEKSFIEKSKPFVKLKVDVDSSLSWELKNKFAIRGYPTLIVTNSDLQEIGRVVGYKSAGALESWMSEQIQNQREPLEVLASKKDLGLLKKSLRILARLYVADLIRFEGIHHAGSTRLSAGVI